MWQVSPVAFGPTMRFVDTTLPVKGALFLYTFTGTVDWSQYGSASRKSCFTTGAATAGSSDLPPNTSPATATVAHVPAAIPTAFFVLRAVSADTSELVCSTTSAPSFTDANAGGTPAAAIVTVAAAPAILPRCYFKWNK
jgi:hypothetical protein